MFKAQQPAAGMRFSDYQGKLKEKQEELKGAQKRLADLEEMLCRCRAEVSRCEREIVTQQEQEIQEYEEAVWQYRQLVCVLKQLSKLLSQVIYEKHVGRPVTQQYMKRIEQLNMLGYFLELLSFSQKSLACWQSRIAVECAMLIFEEDLVIADQRQEQAKTRIVLEQRRLVQECEMLLHQKKELTKVLKKVVSLQYKIMHTKGQRMGDRSAYDSNLVKNIHRSFVLRQKIWTREITVKREKTLLQELKAFPTKQKALRATSF